MIKLENIDIQINNQKIIHNLSYEFKKGKITTIIGPNGCGKSTLLKAMMGVLTPTNGVIKLCNRDIREYSKKDKSKLMTMMFQYNRTNENMTVKELISFGRIPYSSFMTALTEKDGKKINEALAVTGLEKKANKKLSELSGGQLQRVFLATCLCQEPQILLLDEPTNHLDIKYQLNLLDLIQKINLEQKLTVISVLHDINLAVKYSDDIIIMKDGKIVDHGTSHEVITEKIIHDVFGVKCAIEYINDNHLIQYL